MSSICRFEVYDESKANRSVESDIKPMDCVTDLCSHRGVYWPVERIRLHNFTHIGACPGKTLVVILYAQSRGYSSDMCTVRVRSYVFSVGRSGLRLPLTYRLWSFERTSITGSRRPPSLIDHTILSRVATLPQYSNMSCRKLLLLSISLRKNLCCIQQACIAYMRMHVKSP